MDIKVFDDKLLKNNFLINSRSKMEVVILTQQDKRKIYNANYLNTENGRLKRAENIKRFYENHPGKKSIIMRYIMILLLGVGKSTI